MHILCTICSDLVNQAENIYVTKCGHVFHYHCLSQWIERSKSCPQCRNKVTDRCMFRLYPTISSEPLGEDAVTLQRRLDDVLLRLQQRDVSIKEHTVKLEQAEAKLEKHVGLLKACENKLEARETAISGLKEQILYLKAQNNETQRLRQENESLKKNMQTMNGLQKVLNATSDEVEQMLEGYSDVRTVATFATALKRALCESESKKNDIRDRLQVATQSISTLKATVADQQAKLVSSDEVITRLKAKLRKYKSQQKRKADVLEASYVGKDIVEDSVVENSIVEDSPSAKKMRPDLDEAFLPDSRENSFNTLVTKIENAESPYLRLQQSSLALSALTFARTGTSAPRPLPDKTLKPSEYALLNSARNASRKPGPKQSEKTSIFQKKEPTKVILSQENDPQLAMPSVSYDGLGGHSKLEVFPKPSPRQTTSRIPKLSAKHKLKRPTTATTGSQDIAKMLGQIKHKKETSFEMSVLETEFLS